MFSRPLVRRFECWACVLGCYAALAWLAFDAVPQHIPAGQMFHRAPMSKAARSIVIPLGTNLHLAFDTELFRTHTVWQGAGLSLYGQAFTNAPARCLGDFNGVTQWSNPPVFPWWVDSSAKKGLREMPARHAFRGLSTKSGAVTLLYEITPTDEPPVQIHETPRLQLTNSAPVLVRRFEVSPCELDLEFLAHAEVGKFVELENTPFAAALLEREHDVLLLAARGRPAISWKLTVAPADYISELLTEKAANVETTQERITRDEARAHLIVPSHSGDISFEIISVVCANRTEALKLVNQLVPAFVQPPDLEMPTKREALTITNPPVWLPMTQPASVASPASRGELYQVEPLALPRELSSTITGMDWLPNGELALCTLSGEVFLGTPDTGKWRRFARGLCEPGGLKVVHGVLYVAQKCELTRLVDTDGDGVADLFECVNQSWGYNGQAQQFAFGPATDAAGNLYVQLDGRRNAWDMPFRAWSVRMNPAGVLEGFCSGLRSSEGFGTFGENNDLFVTDNAGSWIGAAKLNHLRAGFFFGYPTANPAPQEDFKGGKEFTAPAVWLAQMKSAHAFTTMTAGAFKGQLLVLDSDTGNLSRVYLEKVNGEWQGAVWPFIRQAGTPARRLVSSSEGNLYLGGTNLSRIKFQAAAPFEIREVHALTDGFELTFTQPVDAATAGGIKNYEAAQFAYLHHSEEASPEVDQQGKLDHTTPIKVTQAKVSADGLKVQLTLVGAQAGYVTKVRSSLKNTSGQPLTHDTFHYTLNAFPH